MEYYVCMIACVRIWHVMNVCMYVRAQCVCVCVRTVWHFTVHYYYAVSMQATVNEVYYTLIHFRNLK